MRRIKLMADYHCWPLWHTGGEIGNLDPETLPITDNLKRGLRAWAEKYDQTLNDEDPISSGFADEVSLDAFEEEGLRLWKALKTQLNGQYEVTYYSQKHHR